MPTDAEQQARRRRRAWWIASARRADPRKPKLVDVAVAVGLAANSASTVSDWENNVSEPSLRQLERLAAYYGLPLSTFTDPAETEQDRLDDLRALAIAAVELALEDSASAGGSLTPEASNRQALSLIDGQRELSLDGLDDAQVGDRKHGHVVPPDGCASHRQPGGARVGRRGLPSSGPWSPTLPDAGKPRYPQDSGLGCPTGEVVHP